jgi:hypothetical protein
MERPQLGSGRWECPDSVASVLSLVIAMAVAALCVAVSGNLSHGSSAHGLSGSYISFALGCFCGTFVYAILTPSEQWDTGPRIGAALAATACGLTLLLVLASGNPGAIVMVGVMAVATGAGGFSGLAFAPPWDIREVLLALLAILIAIPVVMFSPTYYSAW